MCGSLSVASQFVILDQAQFRLARRLLPGPYTIILEKNRMLPRIVPSFRSEVGIRIPKSPLLLELLTRLGRPIATTSLPEESNISFGYQIEEQFGHSLDLILDLGEEVANQLTTIIDLSSGEPEIVREGVGDTAKLGT